MIIQINEVINPQLRLLPLSLLIRSWVLSGPFCGFDGLLLVGLVVVHVGPEHGVLRVDRILSAVGRVGVVRGVDIRICKASLGV